MERTPRSFWIVSPNVRNDNRTVSEWRQASVAWKAAFMGYEPDEKKYKQTGYKFANVVRPNDIILIARRYQDKSEVVGFGVVDGKFRTSLKGFSPPKSDEPPGFGSLRKLQPFIPMSEVPAELHMIDVLRHTTALRKLHPDTLSTHKEICDWMESELGKLGHRGRGHTNDTAPTKTEAEAVDLSHEDELEYEVRTKQKVKIAEKKEAKLVMRYRDWLKNQNRSLSMVKYKNLKCDAYEKKRGNLIEAKSSSSREYIRMAVGQLLDYSYQGRKSLGKTNMAILLPERPDLKAVEWLSEVHISLIWEEKNSFVDNANGLFT